MIPEEVMEVCGLTNSPKNLAEVMAGDQSSWRLLPTFFAQLDHGLMGTFPAVIRGTGIPVVTTDREVLKKVCTLLTPRKMKITERLSYVNLALGVSVRLPDSPFDPSEECEVGKILTNERFDILVRWDVQPFEWAPGLIGPDMNKEEFMRTLEVALERHPG